MTVTFMLFTNLESFIPLSSYIPLYETLHSYPIASRRGEDELAKGLQRRKRRTSRGRGSSCYRRGEGEREKGDQYNTGNILKAVLMYHHHSSPA